MKLGCLRIFPSRRSRQLICRSESKVHCRDIEKYNVLALPVVCGGDGATTYSFVSMAQEPSDKGCPSPSGARGSTIRPKRQPYWLLTGQTTVAPASADRRATTALLSSSMRNNSFAP